MSTAISQGGVVLFGPQKTKGIAVPNDKWYPHRMLDTDMAIDDQSRTFPPEVGGRPLPGGAYKGGISVSGGFTMNPRLENSLGWLLYALMGKLDSSNKALVYEGVLLRKALTVAEQTLDTTAMVAAGVLPTSHGKICVRVYKGDNTTWTGTVTVAGTGPVTEDFDFATGAGAGQRVDGLDTNPLAGTGYETIVGAEAFTDVTSIVLPAYADAATAPVYIAVGYEDPVALAHIFTIDPSDPTAVKWMGVRKYIPKTDDGVGLGETYIDCKPVTGALNLTNDGPITMRWDVVGRTFGLEENPSWANNPTFEGFESAPIATVLGGYVSVPSFSSTPLPVVSATFAWQNAPLDQRMERVYGTPYLDDVTITGRQMSVQLAVKYKDPDLYRAILGNSKLATTWSPKPFMSRLDVTSISPSLMTGSQLPYGLRVEAQNVMLGMRGGIQLAGNDAVILRLVGTVIDNGGTYARFTLQNLKAGADYAWPTS